MEITMKFDVGHPGDYRRYKQCIHGKEYAEILHRFGCYLQSNLIKHFKLDSNDYQFYCSSDVQPYDKKSLKLACVNFVMTFRKCDIYHNKELLDLVTSIAAILRKIDKNLSFVSPVKED